MNPLYSTLEIPKTVETKIELTEKERAKRITAIIRYAENKLKRRFPLLQKQNLLGTLIFTFSCLGFLLNGFLYLKDLIPAWMCILGNAVYASFLHELEHDLIHSLYFKTKPIVQNFFMWGIWILRGNLISPWYRKFIHLIHHRESGQKDDIEERLIGNGMQWGLKRILITLDPLMSTLRLPELQKQVPAFQIQALLKAMFPMCIVFNLIWISFLIDKTWNLFHFSPDKVNSLFPLPYTALISALIVIYVIPNVVRQISLTFMSSDCHYYGDVPKASVMAQTQVLHPWYFIPFQVFCFNFGSTHIIHHFVVNQPFYLRQMIAPFVHAAMQKYGVRFNDIQSIFRGNRLYAV